MNPRKILIVLFALALFLISGTIFTAGAETYGQDRLLESTNAVQAEDSNWASPTNLSRSGASTNPQMVIDSSGRHHVLWEDEIDGFIYSNGGAGGWSEPRPVELPFFTRSIFPELQERSPTPRFIPTLVADQNGSIHAFWIDNQSAANGALTHSSVPAGSFANYEAWSSPEVLQTGVTSPTADVSDSGLHLVYARRQETADRRAGIYYQRLPAAGGGWSTDRVLYESRYLRSQAAESGSVAVVALDGGRVIAAWDDVGRELVFTAHSQDGGGSWSAPIEIDRRSVEDAPNATGPGGVAIGRFGSQAILTWHAGHQLNGLCSQYYRSLSADGSTWSLTQILPGLDTCLTSAQFHDGGSMLYLLGTNEQGGMGVTELLAWDGTRWSDPQPQTSLYELKNPETNQPISLSCLDVAGNLNQLSLVGCDSGVGGDIWWTTRALGDSATWFAPPSAWQGPDAVAATQQPLAAVRLVVDGAGVVHAFWFEPDNPQIFHARWDGTAWSSAAAIVRAGGETIDEIAVAANGNRLFLVFGNNQGLYAARADAGRPTEWSTPILLTAGQSDVRNPSILLSGAGELLVSYAISLNEPRGIYLLRSPDMGSNWSEPFRIFDGAAAGWDAVGNLQLTETTDGRLHAIWSQNSLPPESLQLGVAYSQSTDGGSTWSATNPVITTPSNWSSLMGFGERSLHLLWAEVANERLVLWDSQSVDGGATWAERVQIGSLGVGGGPAAAFDPTGQLHLIGIERGSLVGWIFDGAGWRAAEPFPVNLADDGELAVVVDTTGRLVVGYGSTASGLSVGTATGALYAMSRPLDLPLEALPTPPPPPPTATPEPTVAPTATPEPTPTVAVPTAPDAGPLSAIPGSSSRAGQLMLAVIPAALVVLIAVVIGIRAVRMGGRK